VWGDFLCINRGNERRLADALFFLEAHQRKHSVVIRLGHHLPAIVALELVGKSYFCGSQEFLCSYPTSVIDVAGQYTQSQNDHCRKMKSGTRDEICVK
jgi:hypothetical protein